MINLKKSYKSLLLAFVFVVTCLGSTMMSSVTAFAGDATGVTASLDTIVANQNADGGWRKYYTDKSGDWAKSTIDNKATYTEIARLAAAAKTATGTKKATYENSCIKGINFLLNMQYPNGGWPQIYGDTKDDYHECITYNDDAMINVMILLDDISNKKGDFSWIDNALAADCATAVVKGVDCIIKTQIRTGGTLTAWGQQHNKTTLAPDYARAYEIPSLCSKESVTIVKFLKTRTQTTQIATAIKAAETWFNEVKITGIKVIDSGDDVTVVPSAGAPAQWARFYELGTNKAIFVDRDGKAQYKLSDISQERRAGYSWYGTWPKSLGIK